MLAQKLPVFLFLGLTLGAGVLQTSGTDSVDFRLARQLVEEGDHRSAAVEWRRLGMMASDPEQQAGLFWASAHQYLRIGEPSTADTMLEGAEWASATVEEPAGLLRAEVALQKRDRSAARFYLDSLQRGTDDANVQRMAHQQLAALAFQEGQWEEARNWLKASPSEEMELLRRLNDFEAGRDKNPRVGGLLGMIPGLGYAYAGEYANAFRSLILNSLFIFGMVDTARNDHWGGFAVITFFEITWYTGSIYGGFDASHRYNQRRRDEFLDAVAPVSTIEPDWAEIPAVILRWPF